jgi:hypothetical protein
MTIIESQLSAIHFNMAHVWVEEYRFSKTPYKLLPVFLSYKSLHFLLPNYFLNEDPKLEENNQRIS